MEKIETYRVKKTGGEIEELTGGEMFCLLGAMWTYKSMEYSILDSGGILNGGGYLWCDNKEKLLQHINGETKYDSNDTDRTIHQRRI